MAFNCDDQQMKWTFINLVKSWQVIQCDFIIIFAHLCLARCFVTFVRSNSNGSIDILLAFRSSSVALKLSQGCKFHFSTYRLNKQVETIPFQMLLLIFSFLFLLQLLLLHSLLFSVCKRCHIYTHKHVVVLVVVVQGLNIFNEMKELPNS